MVLAPWPCLAASLGILLSPLSHTRTHTVPSDSSLETPAVGGAGPKAGPGTGVRRRATPGWSANTNSNLLLSLFGLLQTGCPPPSPPPHCGRGGPSVAPTQRGRTASARQAAEQQHNTARARIALVTAAKAPARSRIGHPLDRVCCVRPTRQAPSLASNRPLARCTAFARWSDGLPSGIERHRGPPR